MVGHGTDGRMGERCVPFCACDIADKPFLEAAWTGESGMSDRSDRNGGRGERTSLQGDRAGGRSWFPLLGHYKNSRIEKSREGGARGAGWGTAEEEKPRKPGIRGAAWGRGYAGGALASLGGRRKRGRKEGDGRKRGREQQAEASGGRRIGIKYDWDPCKSLSVSVSDVAERGFALRPRPPAPAPIPRLVSGVLACTAPSTPPIQLLPSSPRHPPRSHPALPPSVPPEDPIALSQSSHPQSPPSPC